MPHCYHFIELAFIGVFKSLVEALRVILQQADQDIFLLAYICDPVDGKLGFGDVEGVPAYCLPCKSLPGRYDPAYRYWSCCAAV